MTNNLVRVLVAVVVVFALYTAPRAWWGIPVGLAVLIALLALGRRRQGSKGL